MVPETVKENCVENLFVDSFVDSEGQRPFFDSHKKNYFVRREILTKNMTYLFIHKPLFTF